MAVVLLLWWMINMWNADKLFTPHNSIIKLVFCEALWLRNIGKSIVYNLCKWCIRITNYSDTHFHNYFFHLHLFGHLKRCLLKCVRTIRVDTVFVIIISSYLSVSLIAFGLRNPISSNNSIYNPISNNTINCWIEAWNWSAAEFEFYNNFNHHCCIHWMTRACDLPTVTFIVDLFGWSHWTVEALQKAKPWKFHLLLSDKLAARVFSKLENGDIRGANCLAASNDTMALLMTWPWHHSRCTLD